MRLNPTSRFMARRHLLPRSLLSLSLLISIIVTGSHSARGQDPTETQDAARGRGTAEQRPTQAAARSETVAEAIEIDANASSHPLPHFWEKMFGSGRAILSLRDSYRNDLRDV